MKKNLLLTLVSILAATLFSNGQILPSDYVTIWKTDNIGTSLTNQISIPAEGEYTVYYESIPAGTSGSLPASGTFTDLQTINLPAAGTYRIAIKPTGATPFHRVIFSDGGDPLKLLTIEQWGSTVWSSMEGAYLGCENLSAIPATDAPVLTNVTSMRDAFFECMALSSVPNMNNWDVSAVTDMRFMFLGAYAFNEPIGNWNVSAVTDMRSMFSEAYAFNQPISNWDVSAVTNMSTMFSEAYAFNQPIGNWDVSAVTNMSNMFLVASAFNQSTDSWDVSAVTNMGGMFQGAAAFNQSIGKWSLNTTVVMSNMLANSGMDCQNYSATLMGWAANPATPTGRNLGATGRPYGLYASGARNSLTQAKGWTISGDNLDPSCAYSIPATDYVTTWKTDNAGVSASNQIIIPAEGEYTVYFESTSQAGVFGFLPASGTFTGLQTITLPAAGTYRIAIRPTGSTPFHRINFISEDQQKLLTIEQWGTTVWSTFDYAYSQCSNLTTISATDAPILTNVTSMINVFSNCASLTSAPNMNNWDVSAVTNMNYMFNGAAAFNQPIGSWDVSAVTDMRAMFTSATAFNQPIGTWNVSAVTDMNSMFSNAAAFNQPIGSWDVSAVTTMGEMFSDATAFNQPIDNWAVSEVTDMSYMFFNAEAFNQPINSWNVSNVTNMFRMFNNAGAFNQLLSKWTFNSSVNLVNMLRASGMDCNNYSMSLIGWAANPATPSDRFIVADGRSYGSAAVAAHELLTSVKAWTIIDDGLDVSCMVLPVRLVSFTAKALPDHTVSLSWQTAQETGNDRFVVERSTDLVGFEPVTEIRDVAGNSNEIHTYQTTDTSPHQGTSYYRLVQYDLDGTRTYSRIITVVVRSGEYVLYPNPLRDQSFHISIDEPVTASIELYDAKGNSIAFTRKPNGAQTVLITPLRPVLAGAYIIVAYERATKRTFKLTVSQ